MTRVFLKLTLEIHFSLGALIRGFSLEWYNLNLFGVTGRNVFPACVCVLCFSAHFTECDIDLLLSPFYLQLHVFTVQRFLIACAVPICTVLAPRCASLCFTASPALIFHDLIYASTFRTTYLKKWSLDRGVPTGVPHAAQCAWLFRSLHIPHRVSADWALTPSAHRV